MMVISRPSIKLLEDEHKIFLKKVFNFLRACREKIWSFIETVGEFVVSCFNKLCSLVKKLWGSDDSDDGTVEEIPLKALEISEKEKAIVDKLTQKTKQDEAKIAEKLLDILELVENNEEKFKQRKLKAEKELDDLRKSDEELHREMKQKKVESDKRIEEMVEKVNREQEEKDRIANSETERLLSETRSQFQQLFSSQKRPLDPCQDASEQLNDALKVLIDCLDPEE